MLSKTKLQFVASLAALAGLLTAPAVQATDVARLPLKASVLAKPNVIFGIDDSGSMDGEVMLPNNDGAFWWDFYAGSGWDATGRTHFNDAGNASGRWRKMVYLFPNGTGLGNRVYNDGANAHFAIPPTAQFAFLRSPHYNPIYYDPAVTYKPWSPAYVGGATVNYANASKVAAKSHPVYGTGTFDLSKPAKAVTTADWTFTALPGMKLPGTAKVLDGAWKHVSDMGWETSGGLYKVPDGKKLRLSMGYFPATYYIKEGCAVDGSSCVEAPDGNTLKRYEIKPETPGYPSGRDYAAEMQNFANWFQYYRKRKLMLNAAMGQVLEPLNGLRLGAIRFNALPGSSTRITMYDSDDPAASKNGRRVAGFFYETNGNGGTPTRQTLDRIGEEYMVKSGGPIQYACQRNNAFILTDGFANVSSVSHPAYDPSTWGSGAPYEKTYDHSLADLALAYYTVNVRDDLAAGRVPANDRDENTNPHMNTYGLTMGARGLLFTADDVLPPTDPAAWTNPTAMRHPSSVDDLWHATINGRGQMYLADSPSETALKIQKAMSDIISQTGAQGGVAVSTVNLSRGDNRAYFGTYNPAGWAGDVTAYPMDPKTGEVDTGSKSWSAAELLDARDWTTRVIASFDGSGGTGFTSGAVASLVNPGGVYGADADVFAYLRGDRSKEGTEFRTRTSLIGAVINSEPAVQRKHNVIYVQSGEGMLHAIDTTPATAGTELWAFVPRSVLGSIGQTVERGYVFRSQLDGSPTLGDIVGGQTLLVAGMGAAGRSFHALDVTSPRGLTEAGLASKVRWEFPSAGDATTQAKVGLAVGRPRIVKTPDGKSAVLVTSGYNNDDGRGRLFMLVLDGSGNISATHEFDTGVGSSSVDAGLAQVSGYEEDDGTVRFAYGGDLLGNVWKFDLVDKTTTRVARLTDGGGVAQPVTAAPELTEIDGKRVVIVGTGRLLDITDFGSTQRQTVYAFADGTELTNPRASLVAQTYDAGSDTITSNPVDWATSRGWYVDLPAGEQANTQPTIAYGALAFTTNRSGATDCSASSKLYVLDLLSGSSFPGTGFVATEISPTATSSAVTALTTVDYKIVGSGQDADGKPWEREIVNAMNIQPAKNAWREIRRR